MIIAVDFDGTLVLDKFPEIGLPLMDTVNFLKKRKEQGDKLILWTCRTGVKLMEALDFCQWELDLEFDAVNDNLPEVKKEWGQNCRKVYADVYIDDKAYTHIDDWRGDGIEF